VAYKTNIPKNKLQGVLPMSFIEVPKQMLAKVWEAITAAQSAADTAQSAADTAQTSADTKLPLEGGH
jgi:hypothetical protein